MLEPCFVEYPAGQCPTNLAKCAPNPVYSHTWQYYGNLVSRSLWSVLYCRRPYDCYYIEEGTIGNTSGVGENQASFCPLQMARVRKMSMENPPHSHTFSCLYMTIAGIGIRYASQCPLLQFNCPCSSPSSAVCRRRANGVGPSDAKINGAKRLPYILFIIIQLQDAIFCYILFIIIQLQDDIFSYILFTIIQLQDAIFCYILFTIIQLQDAIFSELLTASLNKLQRKV
jgi:hypothetical protein